MANDDKRALRRTTPIGIADYPHLGAPDGKFAKGGAPNYNCKVCIAKDSKNYEADCELRDAFARGGLPRRARRASGP